MIRASADINKLFRKKLQQKVLLTLLLKAFLLLYLLRVNDAVLNITNDLVEDDLGN